jgi:hypothetical protein
VNKRVRTGKARDHASAVMAVHSCMFTAQRAAGMIFVECLSVSRSESQGNAYYSLVSVFSDSK